MVSRRLRHTLIGVVAVLQTTCVHPTVHAQAPAEPPVGRYIVPYSIPDSYQLCVQQPTGLWSCIHLSDLRKLLWSMGRA